MFNPRSLITARIFFVLITPVNIDKMELIQYTRRMYRIFRIFVETNTKKL